MCGISGIFAGKSPSTIHEQAAVMNDTLIHRGPDAGEVWSDTSSGIALGQRRLAIVDLSESGAQPMHSASDRYVIVFNGEIYNYRDIKEELEKEAAEPPTWKGSSDTEVFLAAIELWGIAGALEKATGMFAFALWDKKTKVLQLARDRFGEKPLYYGWAGHAENLNFVFASELKALVAHENFNNSISRKALAAYLRYCYVPTPYSIYENVWKLEPGTILTIDGEKLSKQTWDTSAYWKFEEMAQAAFEQPFESQDEAYGALEDALTTAVSRQLLADVPVGGFLSGGIDSSLIVALMQRCASAPVNTFTIGFEEAGFNEAPYAAAVAQHLGTNHTELIVGKEQTQQIVPHLVQMYDEPFADSSQIPTAIVCQMAKRSVTVALSGDAGDELFAGYNRYHWAPSLWSRLRYVPKSFRKAAGWSIQSISPQTWNNLSKVTGFSKKMSQVGDKLHRFAHRLDKVNSVDDLYFTAIEKWGAGPLPLAEPQDVQTPRARTQGYGKFSSSEHRMMANDSLSYLPDDILTKVDRAAMFTSLETRVPFLDHKVAEVAWRMPVSYKIDNGIGKKPLRYLVDKYIPNNLMERPKAGFAIPIGEWLRSDLSDWAEDLLNENVIRAQGYLDPKPILQLWREHKSRKRDWTEELWTVLMFQAWMSRNYRFDAKPTG